MEIGKILRNPKFYSIVAMGKMLPDTLSADAFYLKTLYRNRMGKKLDLANPVSYNEKLQWIKLYDRNPEYTKLVDKEAVKGEVEKRIGKEYVIPTLGVWDNFKDINFDILPDRFVIKCTHDSGGLIICKDKSALDRKRAEIKIKQCLKRNYYLNTREWPYRNVSKRIIVEQYISSVDGGVPVDYKFFCFDGEPDCVMLCVGREYGHPRFFFYDMGWNRKMYQKPEIEPDSGEIMPRPKNFEKMVEIVHKLSKGYPEVRVDLYNIDGEIFFGEYTFFNQSGFDTEISEATDLYWGEKLVLPK